MQLLLGVWRVVRLEDSPANGTSSTIIELMSGSRAACSRLPIRSRPFPARVPFPLEWRFSGVGAESV